MSRLKVQGHVGLVRDNISKAVINTNKEDYQDYMRRAKARETQRDSLTFSISPNPLKTQRLFIHSSGSGEKHIEIYNVLGEKKFETQTYEESIILENLETGIYVFYLKQDNQKRYKRLVIH